MSRAPEPLGNLVQSIHLTHVSPQGFDKFILSTFATKSKEGILTLYGSNDEGEVGVWMCSLDDTTLVNRQEDIVEAIKGGFLHLDFLGDTDVFGGTDSSSEGDDVKLQFLPPGKGTCTVQLQYQPNPTFGGLFTATLDLLARPTGGGDHSELRALRAELSQKEAEITHLGAKLQSAKANAVRLGSQDSRKMPISPQKKAPANASALQPNQKRRKAVEDEFAGSSDEEDDD